MPTSPRCPTCNKPHDSLAGERCPTCAAADVSNDNWWVAAAPAEPDKPNWWTADKTQAEKPVISPLTLREYISLVNLRSLPRPRVLAGILGGLLCTTALVIWLSQPAPRPTEPEPVRLALQETPPIQEAPAAPVAAPVPALPVVVPEPEVVVPPPPMPEVVPEAKPEPKVEEKPPEAKPEPAPRVVTVKADEPRGKLVIKRRKYMTEEDLRRQIEKATEVALDRTANQLDSNRMILAARKALKEGRPFEGGPVVVQQRTDLVGLPMRMGDACKIGSAAAQHLLGGSVTLRAHLSAAVEASASRNGNRATGDTRPDPNFLYEALKTAGDHYNKWQRPEAIPALLQLLMAENESIRAVLVDQLTHIEGPRATAALAQRAIFDLNPDVRGAALEALRDRPVADYQQILLDGFHHPWPAVADHAAEALVALHLTGTVPQLVSVLDSPDPTLPHARTADGPVVVTEMVKINHLRNCLLCHSPSFSSTDIIRGAVPRTDQPLAPPVAYYQPQDNGIFVRADVTYLQQDFSSMLTVQNHGLWPAAQRFDFMVRERKAQSADFQVMKAKSGTMSEQQKAATFALRELTGMDPGPTAEDWKRVWFHAGRPERLIGGLQAAAGVVVSAQGQTFICDPSANALLRLSADGKLVPISSQDVGWCGLAQDASGRLIATQRSNGSLVAVNPATAEITTLATHCKSSPFQTPAYVAVDRSGGVYLTDTQTGDRGVVGNGAVYYVSAHRTVTRLPLNMKKPRGLALSADEKTLFVATAASTAIHAFPLESSGSPGPGRVVSELDSIYGDRLLGCNGMTADTRGNIYVCHPARNAVQVINSAGAKLALIPFPDAPLHCSISGADNKVLVVTTLTNVYTVKVEGGGAELAAKR